MQQTAADPAALDGRGSITLGGETYLVAQASLSDLATVRQHVRKSLPEPMAMYAALVEHPAWAKVPAKVQEELAREAGKAALSGGDVVGPEQFFDLLVKPANVAFLAWVLLRKSHAGLTPQALQKHVTEANAAVVLADLWDASGLKRLTEDLLGKPSGPPGSAKAGSSTR